MCTNVYNGKGDDIIRGLDQGKKFVEELFGKGGNDKLYGNGGRDHLHGGKGDDKLWGGTDTFRDVFVFEKNSGKDMIADFDLTKDVVQIAKGLNGIKGSSDVIAHAIQKGDNVVIDLGQGNKITLKNVSLDELKKNPGQHFDVV